MLTDEAGEPSASLAGAINGVAATYLLLDLYEESDRLFERMAGIQAESDDPWLKQVLVYNRLLGVATWAIALVRVDAAKEAREQLHRALDRVAETNGPSAEPTADADVALLTLFAELLTHRVDVAAARVRLAELVTGECELEAESYVHFGLAVRATEAGDFTEARAHVRAGGEKQDQIRNDQIRHALRWLGAYIAVLEDPDHRGLQETWSYAEATTQTIWELRLRRRDAVLDRLNLRRLRSEHDQVQRASLEDPLTSLANRRRLDLERAALDAAVDDGWVTAVYLDIDDFKTVNDTLGHDLGDEVLRELAEVIMASVRNHDLVGRYGGDEFVIVSRECDPDDAAALGDRIIAAVRAHRWDALRPELAIRVSAGIAVTDRRYDRLFGAADSALYEAKQGGRDRAVVRRLGRVPVEP